MGLLKYWKNDLVVPLSRFELRLASPARFSLHSSGQEAGLYEQHYCERCDVAGSHRCNRILLNHLFIWNEAGSGSLGAVRKQVSQ